MTVRLLLLDFGISPFGIFAFGISTGDGKDKDAGG
jgi:hypothetical protein